MFQAPAAKSASDRIVGLRLSARSVTPCVEDDPDFRLLLITSPFNRPRRISESSCKPRATRKIGIRLRHDSECA